MKGLRKPACAKLTVVHSYRGEAGKLGGIEVKGGEAEGRIYCVREE